MSFNTDIAALVRPEVLGLENYTTGETFAPTSPEAVPNDETVIRLDANENPYGCSVRVQELLASYDQYHHYPLPYPPDLFSRLEQYTGIKPERMLLGNGVPGLLDLIVRVFAGVGNQVIICPPTELYYRQLAVQGGAQLVEVARNPHTFEIEPEQVLQAVTEKTRLIILGSPNNPTGNVLAPQALIRLLACRAIVVVDESYFEFAGSTVAQLVTEFENLVVLRSFDSWAGLAGMQTAYGLFSREVLKYLQRVSPPSPLSTAQILAANAALTDQKHYRLTIGWIKNERGRLFRQLRKLNFLQPFPSQANFILCQVTRSSAEKVQSGLQRQGILVKSFASPPLANHLRITVGRPEDTDRLMQGLLALVEEL